MASKFDNRQSVQRSLLDQIANKTDFSGTTGGKPANSTELDNLLTALNDIVTLPFDLSESTTPDLVLNIGAGNITNSETSKTRTFSPISDTRFDFSSGTITFPSTSGGTITVSPGTNGTLTVSSGSFIAVLIEMDSTGNLSVTSGTEAASADLADDAANFPSPSSNKFQIGYVIMENSGGTIQNVTNSNIFQFLGGSGGSSLAVQEQDGTPSVSNVNTIKFDNGTLTDEGSGVVSFSSTGAAVTGVEKLILTSTGTIVVDSTGTIVIQS